MREIISIVISLIPAAFAPLQAIAATAVFADVPSTAWYTEAVDFVQSKGLMAGAGDRQTGQRFSSSASESTVQRWALSLAN